MELSNSTNIRTESYLSYVDNSRVIVKVRGWYKEQTIGSTLAEGKTINEAENEAIEKIYKRLLNKDDLRINKNLPMQEEQIEENKLDKYKNRSYKANSNISNNRVEHTKLDLPNIPVDWSKELSSIDLQLEKLGWSKTDEQQYLLKILGLSDRSKITSYSKLKIYLYNLNSLEVGTFPNQIDFNLEELILKSTKLIEKLNWDMSKGRELLKLHFDCNSRNELNQNQLLEFNMILEDHLNSNYSV
ncbi:hypothetical protein [Prochlorococcus sp. MIT 1223]|uniref:hypothetical protein n=1 Tax=Prochlorococcus sp. MIT 1223 TaxID=3096217 RepID=UPI002A7511D3|nr:hypothetical protein [Prochlorococcus sp. MIT 1223]